jgi:hypothetical protein
MPFHRVVEELARIAVLVQLGAYAAVFAALVSILTDLLGWRKGTPPGEAAA